MSQEVEALVFTFNVSPLDIIYLYILCGEMRWATSRTKGT